MSVASTIPSQRQGPSPRWQHCAGTSITAVEFQENEIEFHNNEIENYVNLWAAILVYHPLNLERGGGEIARQSKWQSFTTLNLITDTVSD